MVMFCLLQVRLLTGVGRFNEMSYIFDTLFEHEYFELLCRKGIEKVTYCFLLKNVLSRFFRLFTHFSLL